MIKESDPRTECAVSVSLCTDASAWDEYVNAHPSAPYYHAWKWRWAIGNTFGHQPYYLAATTGGSICGVLPLFHIRSTLFGASLVSIPFFSSGGVLADNSAARDLLLVKAKDLGERLGVRHIELRQGDSLSTGWPMRASKVSMRIELPSELEKLWRSLSSGMRNKIRNGQKHGFRAVWGGAEQLGPFYSLFAVNMRHLGTPVYPRSWFENVAKAGGNSFRILTLFDGGQALASAFLMAHGATLELPWSASLPEARKKYTHLMLYWTFLEWAIKQGFREIDLGRCTPGGGTYEFKRHWGCREQPMHWYYWVPPGKSLPDRSPESPRFKSAVAVWKRLPLPVANGIGPLIARSLP
jgi:FemAB-related protein (PEP-CTERM system-associated)